MKLLRQIVLWTAAAGLFFFAGCAHQTHAEKKQQMLQDWEKTTGKANLPVVRDLIDRGRIDEAKKILQQNYKSSQDVPEVHFLIARVHLAEGRDQLALKSLQKTLQLDPEQDEAWFAMGVLSQEQNELDKAVECYQKAIQLQPAKTDYILALVHLYNMQGQEDRALELLEEKRQRLPHQPEMILALADMAQKRGNADQAVKLYKEALLRQGNNPKILEALGVCYMGQKKWAEAAEVFERMLASTEKDNQSHILHWAAVSTLQAQRYAKALKLYDQLSVIRRDDPQVWLEMGHAALGSDMVDRARYCAEKALQLEPDWADAKVVLGCAFYADRKYEKAAGVFEKMRSDETWEAFGWWMSGRCYQQMGNEAMAQNAFKKAAQLRPNSPFSGTLLFNEEKTL